MNTFKKVNIKASKLINKKKKKKKKKKDEKCKISFCVFTFRCPLTTLLDWTVLKLAGSRSVVVVAEPN